MSLFMHIFEFCAIRDLSLQIMKLYLNDDRFDMESDTLYSVKWYRNEQEFYRFVPNDKPKLQIFPQHGIRVEVRISVCRKSF